jgi:hypothetical protein
MKKLFGFLSFSVYRISDKTLYTCISEAKLNGACVSACKRSLRVVFQPFLC